VRVRLGVNFSKVTYVYVVSSRSQAERDTVEARTLKLEGRRAAK
jgi:rod shape-determining protein MreC